MPETIVSVDEYINERKNYLREDGVLMKASRQSPKTWDPKKRTVDFAMSAEVEDRDTTSSSRPASTSIGFVGDNPIALPMHPTLNADREVDERHQEPHWPSEAH